MLKVLVPFKLRVTRYDIHIFDILWRNNILNIADKDKQYINIIMGFKQFWSVSLSKFTIA